MRNFPRLFLISIFTHSTLSLGKSNVKRNIFHCRDKLKGNFITISWTTSARSTSQVFYGENESLSNSLSDNEFTTDHQITLKIEDIAKFSYIKVKSTDKDGNTYETSVIKLDSINDLGGNPNTESVVNDVYDSVNKEITNVSYIKDDNSNHSITTAQVIPEGTVFGSIEQGNQQDYYAVNFVGGNTYSIKLKGMAEGEDYDISLLDENNNHIAYSVNQSNYDESISYTAKKTGVHYINIQCNVFNSGSLNHDYQLMIYSNQSLPDSFEMNDGMLTAKVLACNTSDIQTISTNVDEDWFVLDATSTGKLGVVMRNIPNDCDYDVEVYDSEGSYIGGSYSAGNLEEKLANIITKVGKYYIRVYSYSGSNASNTYEIKAGIFEGDEFECNDDLYFVNDNSKPLLALNSYITATIDNPDDVDCYKLNIESDTTLGINLQQIPADVDYDMVLYKLTTTGFSEMSRSTVSKNSDESIIYKLEPGDYFIKVYSYYGCSESQSYILNVNDKSLDDINVESNDGLKLFGSYTISGYIKPEVSSSSDDIKSGFKISIDGISDANGITDKNGYFEFAFTPNSAEKYKLLISKPGFLTREVNNVEITSNITIGTIENPVDIWAGDTNQDGTINMMDVISIAKVFNITSDDRFDQSIDFNLDESINMIEVLAIAKHFNAMSSSYSEIEVLSQQSEYVQVVAYEDRTVGLKSDGTVWEFNVTPKQIEGLSNIKSVFCTNQHGILAVSKDDGHILKYTSDGCKEFTKLKHVKKISGGSGHTLYLTEEGSVYASGFNYGFLGIEKGSISGYTVDEPVEVNLGGKKAIDIAASGWAYSLVVIDDGTVYGFGKNDYGQLGIPVGADASEPIYLPVMIPNLTDVKAVAVPPSVNNRAYALKNDGSIWSWGYFDSSLGIGESSEKIIPPTEVIDNSGLRTESIAVSTYTLQAIKEDGSLWNCGVNYGDLGIIGYPWSFDINKLNYKNPAINNIKSISAGYHHVVAHKNDGSVWVWGENRDGQLGTGDKVTRYYPESTSKRRDCYFEALYIDSGYGNGSNSYTYLYNPKSTKLTCSVPKGRKSAKISLSEDDMFAGLTYNVTQAETLPGKAKIEIKENGSIVKEYSINFLEQSDTFYSSADGSIDYGGDSNMYFIGLEKDKTYKIYSTGNTDTFLEVRDDNFEICDSNDDGETGSNFCLTFTPKKTTNYVLIVKHFDEQAGTGKYNICIQDATDIEGLKEDEEYLDELTKEVLGTLTKDTSGNYIVKIDEQHEAVISDYRIDPYTEKPIVKFIDFIKAFNGYLPYIESPSTQTAMAESDPDNIYKITTSKKGVREDVTYKWDSNVFRIKTVLRLLGCGKKYIAGRTFETLDESGYYGQYTFDAVSSFQKNFMRNTVDKYGEVDDNTAVELQEYYKCYLKGYSDENGWVKEYGVKVREYLTQVLNNTGTLEYRFEDSKDRIYYRTAGTSSLVRLEISSLKYYDKEYKCYAKIKDIQDALYQYQININTSNMPTVVLKSPTNGGKYYTGQTIVIKATGTNCDHMAVYINGQYYESKNGNSFEYNYVLPSAGTYSICVVGRNLPTGGALVSSNVIKLSCVAAKVEDLYNLDAASMANLPIQVSVEGNTVKIKAYIYFQGDAQKKFPGTNITYAEAVAQGIKSKWKTTFTGSDYDFAQGVNGKIEVELYSNDDYVVCVHDPSQPNGVRYEPFTSPTGIFITINGADKQKWLEVNVDDQTSCVSNTQNWTVPSGVMDFITGDWTFDNWSKTSPGRIYMFTGYNQPGGYTLQDFEVVAAHEFGHTLGIGDAYPEANGGKRLKNNAEVFVGTWAKSGDIMWQNGEVLANDIEMVLEAFKTNKWQAFITQGGYTKSSVIRLPQTF